MLLEYKVSNYRSIGDEQILSMIPASKQKEHLENIIDAGSYSALNAVAFYGANAGGKSNLLMSMSLMSKIIHISAKTSSTTRLPYDPFLLRNGFDRKPTEFEITFVQNEKRYRYGFAYNETSIVKEWLYRKAIGREVCLFTRENDIIDVRSGFSGSKKLIDTALEATRQNALFLSECDMFNVDEAKSIMLWFDSLHMINGLNTEEQEITTVKLWQRSDYQEKIEKYLMEIGLDVKGINISVKNFDETDLPMNLSAPIKDFLKGKLSGSLGYRISARHNLYDTDGCPNGNSCSWNWDERESEGAKKALHLSGPILWAIANGSVLIIDEIEAKLHPIMTLNTIEVFLDKKSNPNNAQLIFATHDTNLLSYASLRRDQIYFAEKNRWESTEIFSLSDFIYYNEKDGQIVEEKERRDSEKERRYIEGRYGAIPVLGGFKDFINNITWQNKEN